MAIFSKIDEHTYPELLVLVANCHMEAMKLVQQAGIPMSKKGALNDPWAEGLVANHGYQLFMQKLDLHKRFVLVPRKLLPEDLAAAYAKKPERKLPKKPPVFGGQRILPPQPVLHNGEVFHQYDPEEGARQRDQYDDDMEAF